MSRLKNWGELAAEAASPLGRGIYFLVGLGFRRLDISISGGLCMGDHRYTTTGVIPFASAMTPFIASGWGDWWLPTNYAKHGVEVDRLFKWIFWLTIIVGFSVQAILVGMCIHYRNKPDRGKAEYNNGSTAIELAWTIIPVGILAILSFFSIRAWNHFRYSADFTDPGRAKVLVIGQQFKWNIVYPGPDGKFGQYLEFPKPTDLRWPVGANGKSPRFAGVVGPASLPYAQAVSAIGIYCDTINPLGKVFTDPDGTDDDYQAALARTMYIPVNRPVEIEIASKDVIHDFYLPNFRAQLYAVPGMIGKLCFTATQTSKEIDPGYFDIACAQICGLGHYTMQGRLVVLPQEEYDQKFPTFPHLNTR